MKSGFCIISLLFGAILLSHANLSFAQEQNGFSRFELSASAGLYELGIGAGVPKGAQISSIPILLYEVSFRYFPQSWLSVGLSVGNNAGIYWGDKFDIILTPSVNFHWYRKRSFTAYSGIGLPLPVTQWNNYWPSRFHFMDCVKIFQYTLVGITFGRSVYGLAELGYGYRNFPLRLGVGYRF